jgi:hypothetical protein
MWTVKRYRIGRAETNDIVLEDGSVSREHAELVKLNRSTFLLRDLGSTYGTSARQGSDWHLVTAENVDYITPIRIGEIETTVAEMLQNLDPLAVYMEERTEPPWIPSSPRLSEDAKAHHPETIMQGWMGASPASLFAREPRTNKISVPPDSHSGRFIAPVLAGAFAAAALFAITAKLL